MRKIVIGQESDAKTDPTPSADERLVEIFGAAPPHVPDVPVRASQPLHTNPNLRKIIKRISAGDQNAENLMRWHGVPWMNEQAERWRDDDTFAAVVARFVNGQQSKHVVNANDSVHRSVPLDDVLRFVGLRGQHITLEERLWLDSETKKNQRRTSTSEASPQRRPLPESQFDPITSAERTEAVAALAALPCGFVQAVAQAYAADELADRPNPLYSVADIGTAQTLARLITGAEEPMHTLRKGGDHTLTHALQAQPRVLLFDCHGERVPLKPFKALTSQTKFMGPRLYTTPILVPLNAVVIVVVGARKIDPDLARHVVEIPSITGDVDVDKVRGAVQYFIRCGLGANPIQRVLSALPPAPAVAVAVAATEPETEANAAAIERFLSLAHETFGDRPTPIGKITPTPKDETFAELLVDLTDSVKMTTFVELYYCHRHELGALKLGDDAAQWPKQLGTILKQTTLTEMDNHPHLNDGHPHLNGSQTTQIRASRYRVTLTRPQGRAHYAIKPVMR